VGGASLDPKRQGQGCSQRGALSRKKAATIACCVEQSAFNGRLRPKIPLYSLFCSIRGVDCCAFVGSPAQSNHGCTLTVPSDSLL
jgi:hypothetical protein